MYTPQLNKTQTIILLLVLLAIGGIVLYGQKAPSGPEGMNPPKIQGPSTPPPGYEAPR